MILWKSACHESLSLEVHVSWWIFAIAGYLWLGVIVVRIWRLIPVSNKWRYTCTLGTIIHVCSASSRIMMHRTCVHARYKVETVSTAVLDWHTEIILTVICSWLSCGRKAKRDIYSGIITFVFDYNIKRVRKCIVNAGPLVLHRIRRKLNYKTRGTQKHITCSFGAVYVEILNNIIHFNVTLLFFNSRLNETPWKRPL